jgi:hypothetical protein
VEVFDFGQEGQDMYLVMEFVDGQSLGSILKQLKAPSFQSTEPLDAQIVAALICQAAEGLSVAARQGVVHRDIKPENMMIDQQGYLKISDFGIAHVQDDSLTKTGTVLGSPHYMSPEQARGFKPITSQADMFSLGAVFYTCLAGHPPFQGKSLPDLFQKIVREPPVPLWRLRQDVDPFLVNLVDTLLHKDPAQRGDGPKWLHRQLQGYLLSQGIVDPAERVCAYLRGLSAQGVQTTWRSESSQAALSHTQRTLRYSRESKREIAMGWPIAAVVTVILITAGLWYRLGQHKEYPVAVVPTDLTLPAAIGPLDPPPTAELSAPIATVGQEALLVTEPGTAPKAIFPEDTASRVEEASTLLLQSSPPFAEVFIDGRFIGLTPVKVDALVSGRHRIVLKGKHSPVFDTLLNLRPGAQVYKFMIDKDQVTHLAGTAVDEN